MKTAIPFSAKGTAFGAAACLALGMLIAPPYATPVHAFEFLEGVGSTLGSASGTSDQEAEVVPWGGDAIVYPGLTITPRGLAYTQVNQEESPGPFGGTLPIRVGSNASIGLSCQETCSFPDIIPVDARAEGNWKITIGSNPENPGPDEVPIDFQFTWESHAENGDGYGANALSEVTLRITRASPSGTLYLGYHVKTGTIGLDNVSEQELTGQWYSIDRFGQMMDQELWTEYLGPGVYHVAMVAYAGVLAKGARAGSPAGALSYATLDPLIRISPDFDYRDYWEIIPEPGLFAAYVPPGPEPVPVPEPSTLSLFAVGLAGLGFACRKRSGRAAGSLA